MTIHLQIYDLADMYVDSAAQKGSSQIDPWVSSFKMQSPMEASG